MYKPGNRKSYALLFKLKVAKEVIEQNKKIQTTAFKYYISNKSMRDQLGKIVEIKEQLKKRNNRLSFRMRRRGLMTALETGLFNCIKDAKSNGACLSRKVIKLKELNQSMKLVQLQILKLQTDGLKGFQQGLDCAVEV